MAEAKRRFEDWLGVPGRIMADDVRNLKNEVFSTLTYTVDSENSDDRQGEIRFTRRQTSKNRDGYCSSFAHMIRCLSKRFTLSLNRMVELTYIASWQNSPLMFWIVATEWLDEELNDPFNVKNCKSIIKKYLQTKWKIEVSGTVGIRCTPFANQVRRNLITVR